MEYKIEKGVPIPPKRTGREGRGLLNITMRNMEVGDSILLPIRDARTKATTIARRIGIEITQRQVDDENARVWRTA